MGERLEGKCQRNQMHQRYQIYQKGLRKKGNLIDLLIRPEGLLRCARGNPGVP